MKLTLGSTYYNNPDYLLRFYRRNRPFVDEMIIVDDGSKYPITDYLKPNDKLRLFRVKKDYGFNSHGCRNLIMKMTSNPWVILMDLDRQFIRPEVDYYEIRNANLKKINRRYCFVGHSKSLGPHKSVNDYLIHQDHFFSAGGYDEELIGIRNGDRQYFEQLLNFGDEKILYSVNFLLTRRSSVILGGDAASELDRPFRTEQVKLLQRRIKNPEPNKPILTFEWEEII